MPASPALDPPEPPGTALRDLLFVPLGGLGEVGMNCFALEQDGAILVVDCGVTFPEDDIGVDVIHPDFSWLVERQRDICGLFITHGHEDHIGAVPHLLSRLQRTIDVFAPTHACALLGVRLIERGLDARCLRAVNIRSIYPVGPFSVEPIAVAHSIVDATALSIRTAAGTVLHTGDFDFDNEQPAGYLTDEARLRELGDEGVRLLLSDSTNIDRWERGGSEGNVADELRRVISEETARVVVAMFSSNVHRLAALGRIAEETGRKICLLGTSLSRQVDAARAIGRLAWPSSLVIHPDDASEFPAAELLVLAGGSQAEEPSSLRRLSLGTHPKLRLERGDCVVMSARVIVGNERAVYRMQNDFLRAGVKVRNPKTDPGLHVSGHAAQSEQLKMLELVRPEAFIPVHGTLHHLTAHAQLATDVGVPCSLTVENGQVVRIPSAGPLETAGHIRSGRTSVALGGQVLELETRRRRVELGRRGMVSVAVALDATGALRGEPTVSSRGIPGVDGNDRALALLRADTRAAVQRTELSSVEDSIRRSVRRTITELSGIRPVVEVGIVTIP